MTIESCEECNNQIQNDRVMNKKVYPLVRIWNGKKICYSCYKKHINKNRIKHNSDLFPLWNNVEG